MAALTAEQIAQLTPEQVNEALGAWRLLDAVMKNPETKSGAHALIKKINPKASIPEYDLKASVDTDVAALRKEIADLKGELKAGKELETYTAEFEGAARKYGITDEGRDKVLELMHKEGIRSPEAGMLLFQERNPAPQPLGVSGWENQTFHTAETDTTIEEMSKPGWVDKEIRAALTDVRKAA